MLLTQYLLRKDMPLLDKVRARMARRIKAQKKARKTDNSPVLTLSEEKIIEKMENEVDIQQMNLCSILQFLFHFDSCCKSHLIVNFWHI